MVHSMLLTQATALGLLASGLLLLIGMLTGIWKYIGIMQSDQARAPYYVDIAHRASLMYAFAALVLAALAQYSIWSAWINMIALVANLVYFLAAILTYVIHGALADTRNQLARPHRLGPMTLPNIMIAGFMWSLIVAEVGGLLVLLAGAGAALWPVASAL